MANFITQKKKGKPWWSYDKMLIEWVRLVFFFSGWTHKRVIETRNDMGVDKTWGRPCCWPWHTLWPTLWITLRPTGGQFLKLGSALLQTCVNTSSVNLSYTRLPSYWRRFAKILGCGQNVGLAMAIVYAMAYPWPTLWSTGNQFSAQHCCTPVQTTYPMNLAYLRLSSVLLAAFRSNFLHRLVVDWNQRNQNAV